MATVSPFEVLRKAKNEGSKWDPKICVAIATPPSAIQYVTSCIGEKHVNKKTGSFAG